jgi:predicted nucleic acid-binding protein
MSYLLDTDIVSAFNKQTLSAKLVHWLQKNEEKSFISLVSIAEMRHGLAGASAAHQARLAQRMVDTEARFTESFIPLDLAVLTRWKFFLQELKSINRTMTCEDSLLAATCLTHGCIMATNNLRHFEPAAQFGLKVENPLA